jgi:hypothetical protein
MFSNFNFSHLGTKGLVDLDLKRKVVLTNQIISIPLFITFVFSIFFTIFPIQQKRWRPLVSFLPILKYFCLEFFKYPPFMYKAKLSPFALRFTQHMPFYSLN